MAENDTVTSVNQLPGYLQDYQKQILDNAQAMAGNTMSLPQYQVAGYSPYQNSAFKMANAGIGSYQPYLKQGQNAVYGGMNMYGQGANMVNQGMGTVGQGVGAVGQGIGATQQGINTIGRSMGRFKGQGYENFMDPYTNKVINQSMRDINRAGAIEGKGLDAQSVGAGAFGGSRQGVQRSELSRNVMDTKARTSADLRSQGFSQAMDRAGSAYEGQMDRIGSAGQAYGQLGQGLGSLAGQYGSLASTYGNLGNQYGSLAGGLTSAGTSMANMGQLGQTMATNDINMLYGMGQDQQDQRQKELDAQRQNQYQNMMQPYQQLGFYSDIFNSMPTSSMQMYQQQQPNPYSQASGLSMGTAGTYNYMNS